MAGNWRTLLAGVLPVALSACVGFHADYAERVDIRAEVRDLASGTPIPDAILVEIQPGEYKRS